MKTFSLRQAALTSGANLPAIGLGAFERKLAQDAAQAAAREATSRYPFPLFPSTEEAYAYLQRRNKAKPSRQRKHNPKRTPFGAWIVGVKVEGHDAHVFALHATKGWRAVPT